MNNAEILEILNLQDNDPRKFSFVKDVVECANEVFCGGIYIPCNVHPCGWDFITFQNIVLGKEYNNVLVHTFVLEEISDGVYEEHPYDGLTLPGILCMTNGRFSFEVGSINW